MSAKHRNPPNPSLALDRSAPPEPAGLSLDKINAAWAEMLAGGEDPYEAGESPDDPGPALAADSSDGGCAISPESIFEAMLFVGGSSPLSARQVAALMRGVRPEEIDAAVRTLNRQYAARGCPYTIESIGSGYRLRLQSSYARLREKMSGRVRQARLSQAAIEVLAAVAYHEPVTSEEVARLRGTASGPILAQLVRRSLLQLERTPGQRSSRYRTTPRFLELFALESLQDLPRSEDLEQPG